MEKLLKEIKISNKKTKKNNNELCELLPKFLTDFINYDILYLTIQVKTALTVLKIYRFSNNITHTHNYILNLFNLIFY